MCASRQVMRADYGRPLALCMSCGLTLLAACTDGLDPFDPSAEPFTPKGMVFVPAGEFIMGSAYNNDEQRGDGDFRVYLDEFYIDRHEVTVADYDAFLDAGLILTDESDGYLESCEPNYNPDHPVNCVTWFEAQKYCQWVAGGVKRLPTEAEWEKAARGPYERIFPWGDVVEGWGGSSGTSGGNDEGSLLISCGAIPVGADEIDISLYGVEAMVSGPIEWVLDYYSLYTYVELDNPVGPTTGVSKVMRGHDLDECEDLVLPQRASLRNKGCPGMRSDDIGFRCVMPRTESK